MNEGKWLSKERLYNIYRGMKSRCYYEKNNRFINYGGRGIKVCDEWKNNYLKFKEWALNNGYDETINKYECSLDRIDVNGDYEPSNCRWVSYKIQMNNKRNNRLINYNGRIETIANWSRITGISVGAILYRINHNWDVKKILELKPIVGRNQYKESTQEVQMR